jgi:hypothetical protein
MKSPIIASSGTARGHGGGEGDGGNDLTNIQRKFTGNCHNKFPPYNKSRLIIIILKINHLFCISQSLSLK